MFNNSHHRLILIQPHHFLSVNQRTADQKAFRITEPSRMFHLPERPAQSHHIQLTAFQEPDDPIVFVLFHKFLYPVKFCPQKRHQTIHTSTEKPSGKFHILIWETAKDPRFCHMVRLQRMFCIFQAFFFPLIIAVNLQIFSRQNPHSVVDGFVPGLHAERRRAWPVNRCRITDRRQQKCKIGIVGIPHVPLGFRLLQRLKIQMSQDFTHQLSAAAGDQAVIFLALIKFHKLLCAQFRRVADADPTPLITVGSKLKPISHTAPDFLRMFKGGPVWFDVASKRRSHKSYRSVLF